MKKLFNHMLLLVLVFTFISLNSNLISHAQITEEFLLSQEDSILEEDTTGYYPYLVKVYRVYNPNLQEHFYTTYLNEYNKLVKAGWIGEDWRWYGTSIGIGTEWDAIYRLRCISTGRHLFSDNKTEILSLVNNGDWVIENNYKPVFYSCGDQMVYRLFNPANGDHILVTEGERDKLKRLGWKEDDINWLVIKKQ